MSTHSWHEPISLLNIISKIFEKIIYKRVINFLNKNNILTANQFGFRSGHSTTLAVLNVIEKLYEHLDESETAIGVYLDIQKAFDCVDHKMLVNHQWKYRPRAYPKHIRKLLTRKAAIWRKLKFSHISDLAAKYRNIAIDCRNEILKFDTENEEKLLKANNLGAFYKFVNKKLSNHSGIAPLKLVTDDDDRANLLNSYFESVFTHDDGSTPSFPSRLPDNTHTSDINTSHKQYIAY